MKTEHILDTKFGAPLLKEQAVAMQSRSVFGRVYQEGDRLSFVMVPRTEPAGWQVVIVTDTERDRFLEEFTLSDITPMGILRFK
jgi:hypothetical protein